MRFKQTARMSRPINNHHQQIEMRRDLREDTADLHARIDRLTLVNEALWTLLQEASNLTDQHLINRIQQLDASDGKPDGVFKPAASRCQKCDAAVGHGRRTCMFCGTEADSRSPFRSV
jgi:heme oxygenase